MSIPDFWFRPHHMQGPYGSLEINPYTDKNLNEIVCIVKTVQTLKGYYISVQLGTFDYLLQYSGPVIQI